VATYHTHLPDYIPHLLKGRLPEFLKGPTTYPVKQLIKMVFSNARYTTAPTKLLVEELRSYGINNVVHLPLGIETKRLVVGRMGRQAFLKKYQLPSNARISFEKKIEVLLKAFALLEDRNTFLFLVGGGPYLKKYQKMAKDLGIINLRFTGFVEDRMLGAAYACSTVFASASDTETFGLTFVEAMAAGVPVVGVRKLGAAEVIAHGRNGFLVRPGDHLAMAKKIKKLLLDAKLRRKIGANGRKTAKQYSLDECVKKMLSIYTELSQKKQSFK
jgi:glycosyltransferase involved in cell wall biosynthesis